MQKQLKSRFRGNLDEDPLPLNPTSCALSRDIAFLMASLELMGDGSGNV